MGLFGSSGVPLDDYNRLKDEFVEKTKTEQGFLYFRGVEEEGTVDDYSNTLHYRNLDSFIRIQFLNNSLIVRIIHRTPSTNITRSNVFSIKRFERGNDVISRECHVVLFVYLGIIEQKRGVSNPPVSII